MKAIVIWLVFATASGLAPLQLGHCERQGNGQLCFNMALCLQSVTSNSHGALFEWIDPICQNLVQNVFICVCVEFFGFSHNCSPKTFTGQSNGLFGHLEKCQSPSLFFTQNTSMRKLGLRLHHTLVT